jgi:hypothetical protein
MPLPRIQRGELWRVDLGYLGKVRPVKMGAVDRALAQVLGLKFAEAPQPQS